MKFLLFGTGKIACHIMQGMGDLEGDLQILGFVDNDIHKCGITFYEKIIFSPDQIVNIQYDYICILLERGYTDVYNQLAYGYHIDKSKLVNKYFLLKYIMMEKYKNDSTPEIQDTIFYWKNNNNLTFFNQFEYQPAQYDEVFWDTENNMPYVFYKERKLYYPRTYRGFIVRNNSLYVISYREMEQHEMSPHRYLNDKIFIQENDIVVDAGAREGEFALPYIDSIKKLYLIENDAEWIEALKMTYKDYMDKVVIIPKLLMDEVNEYSTTLMEIIQEKTIDFIKMDIEGAEVKALSASQNLLKRNNIRCAICCYHRKGDREKIEQIFEKVGYQHFVSNGYVVFVSDPDIFRDADFRKGIVYALK